MLRGLAGQAPVAGLVPCCVRKMSWCVAKNNRSRDAAQSPKRSKGFLTLSGPDSTLAGKPNYDTLPETSPLESRPPAVRGRLSTLPRKSEDALQ